MQVITPSLDYGNFIAGIAKAPARVLLLDYDGTLAPFRVNPGEARPYPEVVPVLKEVMRAGGTRVVVVSGRPAGELPPLLALDQRPEIWGSHGWERLLPDGTTHFEQPSEEERRALDEAARAGAAVRMAMGKVERRGNAVLSRYAVLAGDAIYFSLGRHAGHGGFHSGTL